MGCKNVGCELMAKENSRLHRECGELRVKSQNMEALLLKAFEVIGAIEYEADTFPAEYKKRVEEHTVPFLDKYQD